MTDNGLFILEEDEDIKKSSSFPPLMEEEIEGELLSPGDIFWIKSNGDQILISPYGSIINHEQLNKFLKAKVNIVIDMMVNYSVKSEGVKFFDKLKHANTLSEKNAARNDFLVWNDKLLWSGITNGSFVDVMNVFLGSVHFFDPKIEEVLLHMSQSDFQRSILTGSMSVIFALALGYNDYSYLQDLYHLHFIFDQSLNSQGMSFTLREAAEKERQKSGEGVSHLLINKEEGPEMAKFKKHAVEGQKLAKKIFGKLFHSSDTFHLVGKHHEKINGKGFPKGLHADELSEIEQIVILSGHLFSFDELNFKRNDARSFFEKILKSDFVNKSEIISNELVSSLIHVFEKYKNSNTQKMVVG